MDTIFLKTFDMTRLEKTNPRSTDCKADAPITTPSLGERGSRGIEKQPET